MPRTHYRNGDLIALDAHGCDGCSICNINGVLCHELGCAYAWRDYQRKCTLCGGLFWPKDVSQTICEDCFIDSIL